MTYAVGQNIAATDFMGFRGAQSPGTAYPNSSAATNAVAALVGVGYGSRGYGQTTVTLPAVATVDVVLATTWNDLFAAMAIINTQTGSALTLPSNVSTVSVIQADTGGARPNLPNLISTLDSNRLNYDITQMSVDAELSDTRSTSWINTITHEFTQTFSSEDAARYFYNTGGQIYISGSLTEGSGSHLDVAFAALLSQMGTIKIGAVATTYTGTGGTVYPIGYYGLTGTFQTLFTHYGSAYGYTGISYTIQSRVENVVGLNGGNGTVVRTQAIFATNLSSPYDTVDGNTNSTVQQLIADTLSVTSPTYTTTISL
jgi:hypothetical protein